MSVQCVFVDPGTAELAAVQALWRRNSSTLGFFPDGAFNDYASRNAIIGALDGGEVLGYLAFRRSRQSATIVHLCVEAAAQGRGVARQLFSSFRAATSECHGAIVTCRADFAASTLWPRLGFVQVYERPAREAGRTLKVWSLSYGQGDLFTSARSGPAAAIDMNVFLDLAEPTDPRSGESCALEVDWMRTSYSLSVTPELFTEIGRIQSEATRSIRRQFAREFPIVAGVPEELDRIQQSLTDILGDPRNEQDASDRMHLSHAVSGQALFFITRDEGILEHAAEIESQFGLVIVRPSDMISIADEHRRPSVYSPARLDGSQLTVRAVSSADRDTLTARFTNYQHGEGVAGLAVGLRDALANPEAVSARVVEVATEQPIALQITRAGSRSPTIQCLRTTTGGLAATVARHLLWSTVVDAERGDAEAVLFSDTSASPAARDALQDVAFLPRAQGGWVKPFIRGALTLDEFRERIAHPSVASLLPSGWQPPDDATSPETIAAVERAFWPVRIRAGKLPCFIVPIKPAWAAALFEARMAAESLFAPDASLLLRLDNAYYRSARPAVISAPARVLWYVSRAPGYSSGGSIAAASMITEVATGPARHLFARFKRFGVYQWRDVHRLAGSASRRIMAFGFTHTTLLPRPIEFGTVTRFLRSRLDRRYTFVSPVEVPEDVWLDLATQGEA